MKLLDVVGGFKIGHLYIALEDIDHFNTVNGVSIREEENCLVKGDIFAVLEAHVRYCRYDSKAGKTSPFSSTATKIIVINTDIDQKFSKKVCIGDFYNGKTCKEIDTSDLELELHNEYVKGMNATPDYFKES